MFAEVVHIWYSELALARYAFVQVVALALLTHRVLAFYDNPLAINSRAINRWQKLFDLLAAIAVLVQDGLHDESAFVHGKAFVSHFRVVTLVDVRIRSHGGTARAIVPEVDALLVAVVKHELTAVIEAIVHADTSSGVAVWGQVFHEVELVLA